MAAKISEAELLELEPASNKLYEKVMKIKKGGRKKLVVTEENPQKEDTHQTQKKIS